LTRNLKNAGVEIEKSFDWPVLAANFAIEVGVPDLPALDRSFSRCRAVCVNQPAKIAAPGAVIDT
jgi:hypothetical protein